MDKPSGTSSITATYITRPLGIVLKSSQNIHVIPTPLPLLNMRSHAILAMLVSVSGALYAAGVPAAGGSTARGEFPLAKRFDQARFTFYDTNEALNLGACGETITNNDFFVALNAQQYKASTPAGGFRSTHCGQSISITANGKTTTAKIMDECFSCPSAGGLDLTPALFTFFAPLSEGILVGSWNFLQSLCFFPPD
ncbi:hypothetical protein BD779DRAFT_347444 [Infundibulicybe gibba]|nr:hypothetical protein BD779DRAFT_347444 [Infundibulicybe gibba]